MIDFESKLRTQLKRELNSVEPSAVAWQVISNGRTKAPWSRIPRRFVLGVATLGAAAAVTLALLTTGPADRDDAGLVAPPGPQNKPGVVIDDVGDAAAPHLDLAEARLRVQDDSLSVSWKVVGPVPKDAPRFDLRIAFLAENTGDADVLLARVDGEELKAGVARCRAVTDALPNCDGVRYRILRARPTIDGATVSLTVPLNEVGVDVNTARWTAYVQEVL